MGQYDPARVKLQDIMKINYMNMDIVLKVRIRNKAWLERDAPHRLGPDPTEPGPEGDTREHSAVQLVAYPR